MADEEDYDSEDDFDYVPTAEDVSEEENSGEEEDLSVLGNNEKLSGPRQKKQQKKNDSGSRKRKGGIKLDEEDVGKSKETEIDEVNVKLAREIEEEKQQKKEANEKKKADDLWSSFLSDVKPPPKKTVPPSPSLGSLCKLPKPGKESEISPSVSKTNEVPNKTVEITKVFDFAGEEVKVTKTVAADSNEAKKELKSKEKNDERNLESTPTKSGASVLSNIGIKRPSSGGGLGGILNKIGKKQKISVLEKSKMDWNSFKKDEGIEDDLKIHNNSKQGYIERMKFLERTDLRQFEIEKNLRQSSKRS